MTLRSSSRKHRHTMRPQRRGVPGGAGPGAAPGGRPAAGRLCRADVPVRLHARRPARGCAPACLHWHAGGCLPALARYTKGGGRTELLLVGAAAGGAVRGPCAAGLLVRRPVHAASPRALPACLLGTTCLALRLWNAPGHPATPQATSWCGRSPTRSGRCCSAGWAAVPRHSWCCWTTGCMCPCQTTCAACTARLAGDGAGDGRARDGCRLVGGRGRRGARGDSPGWRAWAAHGSLG